MLKRIVYIFLLALLGAHRDAEAADFEFSQPDAKRFPDLFVWSDICNVHILRDGDHALLIELGEGSVVDHLKEIGVKHIDWVLFTNHHRELCQSAPRLKGTNAKLAAP